MIPEVEISVDFESPAFKAIDGLINFPWDDLTKIATKRAHTQVRLKYFQRFTEQVKNIAGTNMYRVIKELINPGAGAGVFTGSTYNAIQWDVEGQAGAVYLNGRLWPSEKVPAREISVNDIVSGLGGRMREVFENYSNEQSSKKAKAAIRAIYDEPLTSDSLDRARAEKERAGATSFPEAMKVTIKRERDALVIRWPPELLAEIPFLHDVAFPVIGYNNKAYGRDWYSVWPEFKPAEQIYAQRREAAEKRRQERMKKPGYKPRKQRKPRVPKSLEPFEFMYLDDEDVDIIFDDVLKAFDDAFMQTAGTRGRKKAVARWTAAEAQVGVPLDTEAPERASTIEAAKPSKPKRPDMRMYWGETVGGKVITPYATRSAAETAKLALKFTSSWQPTEEQGAFLVALREVLRTGSWTKEQAFSFVPPELRNAVVPTGRGAEGLEFFGMADSAILKPRFAPGSTARDPKRLPVALEDLQDWVNMVFRQLFIWDESGEISGSVSESFINACTKLLGNYGFSLAQAFGMTVEPTRLSREAEALASRQEPIVPPTPEEIAAAAQSRRDWRDSFIARYFPEFLARQQRGSAVYREELEAALRKRSAELSLEEWVKRFGATTGKIGKLLARQLRIEDASEAKKIADEMYFRLVKWDEPGELSSEGLLDVEEWNRERQEMEQAMRKARKMALSAGIKPQEELPLGAEFKVMDPESRKRMIRAVEYVRNRMAIWRVKDLEELRTARSQPKFKKATDLVLPPGQTRGSTKFGRGWPEGVASKEAAQKIQFVPRGSVESVPESISSTFYGMYKDIKANRTPPSVSPQSVTRVIKMGRRGRKKKKT